MEPRYMEILFKHLGLSEEFLQEHSKVVRDKLSSASVDIDRINGHIFAINQCLHLAASIVLRDTAHLNKALNAIRNTEGLADQDPATVVTIAALYYLLQPKYLSGLSDVERDRIGSLRKRFTDINWMIGPGAMHVLGMED